MGFESFPQSSTPKETIKENNSGEISHEQIKGLKEIVKDVVEIWKQLEKNEIPKLPSTAKIAKQYIETLKFIKKGHSAEENEELFERIDSYIDTLKQMK